MDDNKWCPGGIGIYVPGGGGGGGGKGKDTQEACPGGCLRACPGGGVGGGGGGEGYTRSLSRGVFTCLSLEWGGGGEGEGYTRSLSRHKRINVTSAYVRVQNKTLDTKIVVQSGS